MIRHRARRDPADQCTRERRRPPDRRARALLGGGRPRRRPTRLAGRPVDTRVGGSVPLARSRTPGPQPRLVADAQRQHVGAGSPAPDLGLPRDIGSRIASGSGSRGARIHTSCAVVVRAHLGPGIGWWCFTVECDRPSRRAAAFSDPAPRTAATTTTSRSVARPAGRSLTPAASPRPATHRDPRWARRRLIIARPTPVGRATATSSGSASANPGAYADGVSLTDTILLPATTIRS